MSETSAPLNEEERLKSENDFLKMKLMLEKGAHFGGGNLKELDPGVENQFLSNIMEFEKQFEDCSQVKIFDKLGQPGHFPPASEIPDEAIEKAWEDLSAFLFEHGISLGACSPNISARELYRFTIEELFQEEIDDINIPGMMQGYIYDEFHPDHVYDNTRLAKEECIDLILRKDPLQWVHHFKTTDLWLNDHHPLSIEEFKDLVNQFKSAYDRLEVKELAETACVIEEKECRVTGSYKILVAPEKEIYTLSGNWEVEFELEEEMGYWYISKVRVEGIGF